VGELSSTVWFACITTLIWEFFWVRRWHLSIYLLLLQTQKKSLRIQQHPASAFPAAIKNSTRTGQAQASKTSQANTTKHYSTHSSVGTHLYIIIYLSYKHTRSHYAFSSTQQEHSHQRSKIRHGQDKHRKAKHHKQTPQNITPHIHL
jgi:hypothetical protein